MVAVRESAGQVVKLPVARRRRSKPQKIETRSSGRSAVLAARTIAGRRSLICDGHFESEGITGRADHEGHRRPGQPTIGSSQVRNGGCLRPKSRRASGDGPTPIADPRPTRNDAGKAPYFSAAEPANGRRSYLIYSML